MRRRILSPNPHRLRLRAAGAGLLGVSALGLSGCQSITADGPDAAQVRFVDASTDAPALDLYLNANGVAYNLSFGTVTSYVAAGPGEYHISANRANTGQALVNAKAALGATRQYTAVISNSVDNLQENVYPDAHAPAPAGTLAVRVLNAAASMGPVDVYLLPSGGSAAGSTPLARDLGYPGDGGYIDVPANGSYSVEVVPAGVAPAAGNGGLLSGVSVKGSSEAVRTVVLGDAPTGSKGLNGFVLEDFDTP